MNTIPKFERKDPHPHIPFEQEQAFKIGDKLVGLSLLFAAVVIVLF